MQISAVVSAMVIFTTSALCTPTDTVSVSYDSQYDNTDQSLFTVACSDGSNGLLTEGFTTFGSLPNFPNIGGVPAAEGYNSENCGSCWAVTFNGNTVNILAVDQSTGFNIGLGAMNNLTNGQAEQLGRISATAVEVDGSQCGF